MTNPPDTISVPKGPLDDLESAFLQLRFMANRVVAEIEKGTDPQPLAGALRQAADRALMALSNWREARWRIEHKTAKHGVRYAAPTNGQPSVR